MITTPVDYVLRKALADAFYAWFFQASDGELDQLQAFLQAQSRARPVNVVLVDAIEDERVREQLPADLGRQLLLHRPRKDLASLVAR